MKFQLALLIGTLALAATSTVSACGSGGGYYPSNAGYYAPSYRHVISYPSVPRYVQPCRSIRTRIQAPIPTPITTLAPAPPTLAPALTPAPSPVTPIPSPVLAPAPAAPVSPAAPAIR